MKPVSLASLLDDSFCDEFTAEYLKYSDILLFPVSAPGISENERIALGLKEDK